MDKKNILKKLVGQNIKVIFIFVYEQGLHGLGILAVRS